MQRVEGHHDTRKFAVRPHPTNDNQEKVVEVDKPEKKHERKVLKENGSKQLVRVVHDVYEVFRGLSKGCFTWGVPQNIFNSFYFQHCTVCWCFFFGSFQKNVHNFFVSSAVSVEDILLQNKKELEAKCREKDQWDHKIHGEWFPRVSWQPEEDGQWRNDHEYFANTIQAEANERAKYLFQFCTAWHNICVLRPQEDCHESGQGLFCCLSQYEWQNRVAKSNSIRERFIEKKKKKTNKC